MVKRTIEISKAGSEPGRFGVHLAARNNQLLILVKTDPPRPMPASPPNLLKGGSIPIEDVGVVMVDQRDATYTHHALVSLANAGAAVVLCGEDHLPAAMVTPISTSTELQSRLDVQIRISEPTRKRIWQSIIEAKIRAQARTLTDPLVRSKLEHLAERVRSGDPENREGQAAVAYWPSLFQTSKSIHAPFRRVAGAGQTPLSSDEPQTPILLSKPPNNLLDYGYAVLRAAVVRAITSAGLLPALGIQHRSRANPFCLADDLMEPLRPMIDARVRLLCLQATHASELTLNQDQKAEILKVLAEPVLFPSSVRKPATSSQHDVPVLVDRQECIRSQPATSSQQVSPTVTDSHECIRSQPATSSQRAHVHVLAIGKCIRSQPATSSQHHSTRSIQRGKCIRSQPATSSQLDTVIFRKPVECIRSQPATSSQHAARRAACR